MVEHGACGVVLRIHLGAVLVDGSRLRQRSLLPGHRDHNMYPPAIEGAFGWNGADYAILEKQYASAADPRSPERRYSPGASTPPPAWRPDWRIGSTR